MSATATSELPFRVQPLANRLGLPIESVRSTIELLDDGNTVPFITRYRKDRTGGLDEEQVLSIKNETEKQRSLLRRKETILKSIASQGKLTDELAERIQATQSVKLLEDLYLPFKPKRQTLATSARQRGLEPLADKIVAATSADVTLEKLSEPFVDPDKQLPTTSEIFAGVRHILAERYSENVEIRGKLRAILRNTGALCCKRLLSDDDPNPSQSAVNKVGSSSSDGKPSDSLNDKPTDTGAVASARDNSAPDDPVTDAAASSKKQAAAKASAPEPMLADGDPRKTSDNQTNSDKTDQRAKLSTSERRRIERREARQRRRRKLEQAFKGYFDFKEPVLKVPHHRVLAINRGERARVLKVRIVADEERMRDESAKLLVAQHHPFREFLQGCVHDALSRLVIPSLERELRRELTQKAEEHAVTVFARNLRKLLLQPPVRGRRVLAVDPGFRNGCKLAALDEFGNVLDHGVIHFVGTEERKKHGREFLVEIIRRNCVSAIAIGNGSGCRESEQLVAEIIAEAFGDSDDVSYVIVNEAGASVYSTSALGREELPDYDATRRGAISIGRRLLDPLSELVKINPANIGVGLYQHDMKSKSMQQTLDDVVQSCVNYVGVDVNTASPSLLSYVSGLNQLTARRVYEYRLERGPFYSRNELRDVPGIGEATFVQAAGFLKISGGDNPLDATSIHPESYNVAQRVLEHINSDLRELKERLPSTVRPPEAIADAVGEEDQNTDTEHATAVHTVAATQNSPESVQHHPESNKTSLPSSTMNTEEQHNETAGSLQQSKCEVPLAARVKELNVEQMSKDLSIGRLLLEDILSDLTRPGRDPREDLPPTVFRRGVLNLEDLKPGMQLTGTVLNVVDFGAFVDIGISDSGLIHISRLADRYVNDPHEVVAVGDVVTVWVVEVDKERRRVSLTAIAPGTEKPRRPKAPKPTSAREKQGTQRQPNARARNEDKRPRKFERRQKKRSERRGSSRTVNAPKTVVPITKKMEEGKEPMRTFSDLKQFFEKNSRSKSDTDQESSGQS